MLYVFVLCRNSRLLICGCVSLWCVIMLFVFCVNMLFDLYSGFVIVRLMSGWLVGSVLLCVCIDIV